MVAVQIDLDFRPCQKVEDSWVNIYTTFYCDTQYKKLVRGT